MRIIGGKYKGRLFNPGKNFKSRPTTDYGKESLFNILENSVNWEDTDALDLFSGTGSISLELVSRGCKSVTSVEIDFRNCRFIRETTASLGIRNVTVVREDVLHFLSIVRKQYDLVFADPPYSMPRFAEIAEKITASNVLKPGALFVLEHPGIYSFSHLPEFREVRNYGSVHFSFFRMPG